MSQVANNYKKVIKSMDETHLLNHPELTNPNHDFDFFKKRSVLLLVILAFLFLIAFAIRAYHLNTSRILAEVQFRAALIARANYFEMTDLIPDWRRQANINSIKNLPVKEPPVMESFVALIYRLVGKEDLRIARFLASIFWVVGGIFLYKIAKKVISRDAAVVATAYYLFVPLGVVVSISFLPDPLMIMMFLFGLFTILQYYDQPSKSRLLVAAVISGLAILVKPLILFTILGAFVSLAIYKKADTSRSSPGTMKGEGERPLKPLSPRRILKEAAWKRVIDLDLFTFLGICFLPVAFYYLYGILIAEYLAGQAQASFLPQLLLTREYWKDWLRTAVGAVGYTPLVAALLGVPMLRPGLPRALLIGLWVGYAVFCLVFTYHIRFAGHYHLQLVIIVALSFGPIIDLIINHLRQLSNKWYWWIPVTGALLVVMYFNIRELRQGLEPSRILETREVAQEIGEIVNHSSRVVYVAHYYGRPLEYYGELSGDYWPRKISDTDRALRREHERSIDERLAALDFSPEYFVITNFDEFDRHHTDLKEFLINNCSLIAESEQYLIYEACTKQSVRSN